MVLSEFCRKMEEKGFRFSLVDIGKPLHGQEDGRLWLDRVQTGLRIRSEIVRHCHQVTATLG